MKRQREYIYPAARGVSFVAYEIREGHWAVSRRANGAEQFLRIYPTHLAAQTLAINEGGRYQADLFDIDEEDELPVESFDCFQAAYDDLPGQRGLFDA